jgi:RNA recognition motif-containing protein
MSEEIVKRLFVGGIADDCTEKDLNGRFERFGKILTVDIPQDVVSGKPKGFGYISIKITEQSFKRCVSLLNKTKWRGKELKIEEAKPDYMQRLRNEWDGIYEEQDKKNKNKLSKKKIKETTIYF